MTGNRQGLILDPQNNGEVTMRAFRRLAVVLAMIFLFPLYWALSTSLRNPMDTFTVTGLGIPWINFEPTLGNWIDQLATEESRRALTNSTVIAIGASVLALILGTPAAYALARFRFSRIPSRDITVWFLSQRVLPPGTVNETGPIKSETKGYHMSWMVQVLPYLEMKPVYSHVDFKFGVYHPNNSEPVVNFQA